MLKKTFLPIAIVISFCLFLSSCDTGPSGPSGGGEGGGTIYVGVTSNGNLLTLAIDMVNNRLWGYNLTEKDSIGPLAYSRMDTNNWGFQNMYKSENFYLRDVDDSAYVIFILNPRSAAVFQLFLAGNDAPIGGPGYAVCKKNINIKTCKEKAYNMVNINIDNDEEIGFMAFDKDAKGLLYGAVFTSEDNKVNNINPEQAITTEGFNYYEIHDIGINSIDINEGSIALIGTQSGALLITDLQGYFFGASIPQTAKKEYDNSLYNGTYFCLAFSNRSEGENGIPIRVIAKSGGLIDIAVLGPYGSLETYLTNMPLIPLSNLEEGPNYPPYTITQDFQRFSGCNNAQSTVVKNAYKCNGTFIGMMKGEEIPLIFTFDPTGKFLIFMAFTGEGVIFGFGIKDPNYNISYEPPPIKR